MSAGGVPSDGSSCTGVGSSSSSNASENWSSSSLLIAPKSSDGPSMTSSLSTAKMSSCTLSTVKGPPDCASIEDVVVAEPSSSTSGTVAGFTASTAATPVASVRPAARSPEPLGVGSVALSVSLAVPPVGAKSSSTSRCAFSAAPLFEAGPTRDVRVLPAPVATSSFGRSIHVFASGSEPLTAMRFTSSDTPRFAALSQLLTLCSCRSRAA